MYNSTIVGMGLVTPSKLFAWGLGSFRIEIEVTYPQPVSIGAGGGGGGGGGDQRRTYLFGSRNIQFTVSFRSSTAESTFINPQDIVRGKVSAKRELLLVKAKKE